MDQKQFIEKLSALAELKQVKVPANAATRQAVAADTVYRSGQLIEIDPKNNPTLNLAVKKIKSQSQTCPDCHDQVLDRIVERRRCDHPRPHWRERCAACGFYRDPTTGQFDLKGAHTVQLTWTTYLNSKNKPKSQSEK